MKRGAPVAALAVVAGGAFGIVGGWSALPRLPAGSWFVGLAVPLAGFLFGCFALVYLHELGHAIVGARHGFDPLSFVVGPTLVDLSGERPRLVVGLRGGMLGGLVVLHPPDVPAAELVPRWRAVALAGPATDLLVGAVLLGAAWAGLFPGALVWLLGAMALASALANALPVRVGGLRSDGAVHALLRRGGAPAERYVEAGRFARLVLSPAPPSRWPDDAVAAAERLVASWDRATLWEGAPDAELAAAMVLAYHHTDRGDHARVRALLESIVEAPRARRHVKDGTFAALDTVLAAHLALRDGDALRARGLLARVPPRAPIRANSLWHGAWAAVHLAEGDRARAAAEARRALKLLRRGGLRHGADRTEEAWLLEVLKRAGASVPTARPVALPSEPAPLGGARSVPAGRGRPAS